MTPPEDQGCNADTRHLASRRKIGLLILKRFAKPGRMQGELGPHLTGGGGEVDKDTTGSRLLIALSQY